MEMLNNQLLENIKVFSPEFLADAMKTALAGTSEDNLAYLFATGKNELYLRDLLSVHLHNTLDLVDDDFVEVPASACALVIVADLDFFQLANARAFDLEFVFTGRHPVLNKNK